MAAVTRRWVRPTSRTSELVPRAAGMRSASQQIRRIAEAESCSPVSVAANPERFLQVLQVHGQGQPRDGAVGLGQQVGRLQPPAGVDEGVEHPGAVVAGVASVMCTATHGAGVGVADRAVAGSGPASGDQGGLDERGVLGRAAAGEPGAAGVVLGDRELTVRGGRPVRARSRACSSRRSSPSGSTSVQESSGELLQVGGVQCFGLPGQDLDSAFADLGVAGECVDGSFDDLGLPGDDSQPSRSASPTGASSGWSTPVARRTVAGPVPLWPPATVVRKSWVEGLPGGLHGSGGVELADDAELDGFEGGLERLDLGDGIDQPSGASGCPEGVGESADVGDGSAPAQPGLHGHPWCSLRDLLVGWS